MSFETVDSGSNSEVRVRGRRGKKESHKRQCKNFLLQFSMKRRGHSAVKRTQACVGFKPNFEVYCAVSGNLSSLDLSFVMWEVGCCENFACAIMYIKHLAQSFCSVNNTKWIGKMIMETWHILTTPRSDIPILGECVLRVYLLTVFN